MTQFYKLMFLIIITILSDFTTNKPIHNINII